MNSSAQSSVFWDQVTGVKAAALAQSDWLKVPEYLDPQSVDLMYVDPPFNTGVEKSGSAGSYQDSWDTIEEYITWLRQRLEATLGAIKRTGSILLHLDYRTSHHARVLLDDLLGADRFVNHIIWHYGLGGSSPRRFARKHDDILFYCVDPEHYFFEAPKVPATSRKMAGQMKKATDVLGIPAINNMAAERTGYPTQKPLALLDLLIRACSPPSGVVLDPCCGSGSSLVAAVGAGRRALGSDVNMEAIEISRERLKSLAPKPESIVNR